jgi:hypothetical protein
MALAAVAALATASSIASPAAAANILPTPVPSLAPLPTSQPSTPPVPTPPPHAASCSDSSTGLITLSGRFPIPASTSVSATTEIQILPDSSDARYYLNYTIAQLQQQQAQEQQQQAPGAGLKAVPLQPVEQSVQQLAQSQADATKLSMVLQNLEPVMRGTTVDPLGFWACQGVTPASSYLLFATLSTTMTVTTQATPPPLPTSLPAQVIAAVRQNFNQRQSTTRYYYKMTVHLSPLTRDGKLRIYNYSFPSWQHVATITQ